MDDAKFPRHGLKIDSKINRTKDEILGITAFSTGVDSEINGIVSTGHNTLRLLLRYQSLLSDNSLSLLDTYSLGGFLNLSGNPASYVQGKHVRFASLNYTYEVIGNHFGAIDLPLYLGLSLEAGNAWHKREAIDYGNLVHSASAYIGWNSPLGPMYLSYGKSDSCNSSLYFYLGTVF